MIYVTGPGHGGPGLVANAYLEGTCSEVYPKISCDEGALKRTASTTTGFARNFVILDLLSCSESFTD
jgi:phosphoketolase